MVCEKTDIWFRRRWVNKDSKWTFLRKKTAISMNSMIHPRAKCIQKNCCLWTYFILFSRCHDMDTLCVHDDVIKWKHLPRYWPFVREIPRSPVNSPHKGQWRGALMFSLICAWINGWENNREADDLICHDAHYDFIVTLCITLRTPSEFQRKKSFKKAIFF